MSFEGSDRLDRPKARLDDRWTLGAFLAYVVVVAATSVGFWTWLACEGLLLAFVVGWSGIALKSLVARWATFAPLFGFLAIVVARSHPERAVLGWGVVAVSVLAKNTLVLAAVITLVHALGLPRIIRAAVRLGLPEVLASSLLVMERYRHVLSEETTRMLRARRARNFGRSGRLDWVRLSGLIGMLFVRSFERGERVHAAMVARGWDGVRRNLEDFDPRETS